MNIKHLFPGVLIALQIGAGFVYAVNRDARMTVYWFAAAVLNVCVLGG